MFVQIVEVTWKWENGVKFALYDNILVNSDKIVAIRPQKENNDGIKWKIYLADDAIFTSSELPFPLVDPIFPTDRVVKKEEKMVYSP